MNLGKAIKFARTGLDLTQAELAELSGVSTSYISLIEQNKRDPNIGMLNEISRCLNLPLFALIFLAQGVDSLPKDIAAPLTVQILDLIRS